MRRKLLKVEFPLPEEPHKILCIDLLPSSNLKKCCCKTKHRKLFDLKCIGIFSISVSMPIILFISNKTILLEVSSISLPDLLNSCSGKVEGFI